MIDPTTLDDHAFAVWAAERAGTVLLDVRAGAGAAGLEGKALKDAGDAAAQAELDRVLTAHRPGDAVLSEEAADDKSRLSARRVWIIDPLDGTREFSEPPRDDWAVHVALWQDGDLTAGAVAQPALGQTFSTATPPVVAPATSSREPSPSRRSARRSAPRHHPSYPTAPPSGPGSRSPAPGRRRSSRRSPASSAPTSCRWARRASR